MSEIQSVVHSLAEKFGGQVSEYAGDLILTLSAETILPAARALQGELGFELLSDITAVDYWPQEEPRFHVTYRFTSVSRRQVLNVRVPLAAINPRLPSLEGVYQSANWYEREIFDMFGLTFDGHSDMRRILMPFDWQGHPLRKDYPLGYEEPQYSFNFDEIAARKPFARE